MAHETIRGLVLRYANYRDNDRILTLLTGSRGLVSVIARACRKQNSALAAVCERFCYGEFVVYERGSVLYVSSATLLEAFYPIRENYDRLVSASQIVHTIETLGSNNLTDAGELFELCYHALSFMTYGEQAPKDIEICFNVKLLKLAGYTPVLTRCVTCSRDLRREHVVRFSSAQGGAMCEECAEGMCDCVSVSAIALEAVRRMLLLPLGEMGRVRLPERVRGELESLIYDYMEYNFEQHLRLRGR